MNKASRPLGSELHRKLYTWFSSEVRDNPRGLLHEPLYFRLYSQLARPLFGELHHQLWNIVRKGIEDEQGK